MIFNPYSQTRVRAGPALPNGIRPRAALFCFWWHRAISRWKLISHCLIYARFPRHCHWRAGFRLPGAGMAWCAINFHCHFPLRFAPPTGYRLGHGRMKSWVEWRVDRVGNSFHNRTQPFPTGWKCAAVGEAVRAMVERRLLFHTVVHDFSTTVGTLTSTCGRGV